MAECLYTGIVHDTGVFKYSNTSRRTMEIAGYLMDQGIDFPKIIDGSFYQKSYGQTRVHGPGPCWTASFLRTAAAFTRW